MSEKDCLQDWRNDEMYLLDSSALFEIVHGTNKGKDIVGKLKGAPLLITSITVYEFLVGLPPEDHSESIIEKCHVVLYGTSEAKQSALIFHALRNKGTLINESDILIAGICVANDYSLITCDKDFLKVNELDTILV